MQRITDTTKEVLQWTGEDLKYRQGYIRALLDIDSEEFDVEETL